MSTRATAGFYFQKNDQLLYAPTAVLFPDGSVIRVSDKDTLTFPVKGWSYYDSSDAAYAAFGMTAPAVKTPRPSGKETLQTKEADQAHKAQSEADRLYKIEKTNSVRAESLRAKLSKAENAKSDSKEEHTSTRANRSIRPLNLAIAKKVEV